MSATSCQWLQKPVVPDETGLVPQVSEVRFRAAIDSARAAYTAANSRYLCDQSQVPEVEAQVFDRNQRSSIQLSPELKLRLKSASSLPVLGSAKSKHSIFHYSLTGPHGSVLATVQSMLPTAAQRSDEAEIKVFYHGSEPCLLVKEESTTAGGGIHCVVFEPDLKATGFQPPGSLPNVWKVTHMKLPVRRAAPGESGQDVGIVWGAAHGHVYVEMFGQFYAFPVAKFAVPAPTN